MTDPEQLDAADPLAKYRDRFVGADTPLVYFDGNSLGRPLKNTAHRLADFVHQEWGSRLIRGWDEQWFDLPIRWATDLGRVLLGAAPGQIAVGDSTTVLLYKLMRAAAAARPGRTEIVLDRDNFPTDRYVAQGIAAELGLTLRWIEVDPDGGVTAEQVAEVVGPQTAFVTLSHVAYRSAWIADAAEITRIAHDAGALVLLDLCHSVGSMPVELDAWGVDLAVGCTYKYLNGGPGSPAFLYVAERHLAAMAQPIQGWMGAADPFLMGPAYEPAPTIRRFLSRDPADRRDARRRGHARAGRGGGDRGGAREVGRADGVRHRAVRRDPRTLGVTIASPRDPGLPRRSRHARPPEGQGADGLAVDARRDPRLPRAGRRTHRAVAAVDVVPGGTARHVRHPRRARARRVSPTNAHGQPIGEPVPDWEPRLPPAQTTLTGRYVALEPVAATHAPALFAALAAEEDDASWTYRHDERPADEAGMLALIEVWSARPST